MSEPPDSAVPTDLLVEVVRREAALEALVSNARSKRGLAEAIGVSDATAHRIIASFRESGLVERTNDGNAVTPLGREVVAATAAYRAHVEAAKTLEPLLARIDLEAMGAHRLDVRAFASATITTVTPSDPYAPVTRFTDLLSATDSLCGFDTTSVSPTYVEDVFERLLDGMTIDIVYQPAAIDAITDSYPDLAAEAFALDNLTISVYDPVPFGLALFDDRIGIGGYDDETGLLEVFVDTDDPEAVAWGKRLYERVREAATPL